MYVVGIVGLDVRRVLVRIADANTPAVVIEPTGSSSQLVEGATSGFGATATYTVRLTMAPTGPIQIRLSALATPSLDVNGADCGLPSGCLLVQVRFVAGVGQTLLANGDLLLTFDSTNWATPQTVTVVAIDDAVVDGSDLQSFADSARRVSGIQGPLLIDGGDDPNPPVQLTLDGYLPIVLPGSPQVTR